MKQSYKIHLVHLLALCVYRNKGRGWAEEEEEEKERRRPGQRGREVDGKGGRDHFVFPFRIAFIVLLQTLTSNTTQPLNPPAAGPSSQALPPLLQYCAWPSGQ